MGDIRGIVLWHFCTSWEVNEYLARQNIKFCKEKNKIIILNFQFIRFDACNITT